MDMANKKGCTTSQLALAWVMYQGNDILPLFGTTKLSRLKENIEASEIKLNSGDLAYLVQHFPEGAFAGTRYAAPQIGMVVN
jgi:aryl-alcohol dehydrogenase-like predicted oxidoreductase